MDIDYYEHVLAIMLGKLLILLLCFIHISDNLKLPICCPLGQQLADANSGFFGPSQFHCKPELSTTNTLETIFGFNIFYTNSSEIPKCDNPLLVDLGDKDTREISTKSCVAKYLNQVQAIYCPDHTQKKFSEVNIVQKCCPYDKVYDYLSKRCVKSNDLNTVDKFSKYFQDPTVFEYFNNLECPADKVIVEYYSEFNDFTFRQNDLFLSNSVYGYHNMKFGRGSYCVENVVLNSSEIVDDKKIVDHLYADNGNYSLLSSLPGEMFVVRSCNEPSVCDSIPCIRRCCGDNEEYVVANSTRQCVPSEKDLNVLFHSYEQSGTFEGVIPKGWLVFSILVGVEFHNLSRLY